MAQFKSTGLLTLVLALCPVLAADSRAQLLLEVDGVELHGAARRVIPGGGTCNVLESDTSYEEKKANHGAPMDVWRLDFSVRNGTGSWLDHLIARYGVESQWPACTNWSSPDPTEVSDLGAATPRWTGTSGFIQKSGRNAVAPGAILTDTEFIIVLRGDPPPRFANWSVDFRLGSGPVSERDAGADPRAAEAALGLDRPARRLIQEKLRAAGFDPGVADGLFGPVTRAAIRRWQAARGVATTGYLHSAAVEALWATMAEAGRDVARQSAREVDVERQAALRTTLRRMALALGREDGANRVDADTPRRSGRQAASRPQANPAERAAAPVTRRPPEPTLPAQAATAPEETVSTSAKSTGFCGLSADDPAYIVVRTQTPAMTRRGWGPRWTNCPHGPVRGCSIEPADDFGAAARYVAGLGGEFHCEFRMTVEDATLDFRVYRFDQAEMSGREGLARWYDMARGAHGWVADLYGDRVGEIDLADWPESSPGR